MNQNNNLDKLLKEYNRRSIKDLSNMINTLFKNNQELKNQIEEISGGGIKLVFSGKATANNIVQNVKPRVLHSVDKLSIPENCSDSQNLLIEGDNLQALASLYKYRNKVDLIIADPPYNTGKDFRYNDKWDEDPNDQGIGNLINSDDNSKHTKWLKFMIPRIQLMKDMLKDSGVLCLFIDYREFANLLKITDEIFGYKNRIAIISWEKRSGSSDGKHISIDTEYILVYSKDKNKIITNRLPRTEEVNKRYNNPDNDSNGFWSADAPYAPGASTHPGQCYGIQHPFTGKMIYPPRGSCWRRQRSTIKELLEEYNIQYIDKDINDNMPSIALVFKDNNIKDNIEKAKERIKNKPWPQMLFRQENYSGKPRIKRYLKNVSDLSPSTNWKPNDIGSSATAARELNVRVNIHFETVKPLELMKRLIHLWSPKDGLILDPFAGSGTTGEAVLLKNQEDGGNRKFILIEQGNPDKNDNYCETLTQVRLKNVITGKWADGKEHQPLKGSFSYKRLTKTIDGNALLSMQRDDLSEAICTSFHDIKVIKDAKYLIGINKNNEGIYLIWNGKEADNSLTSNQYAQIIKDQKEYNLKPYYYIYATRQLYSNEDIIFNKVPDQILVDFGVDVTKEEY